MSVSSGGITGTVADLRLILATALKLGSCNLVLAHNHPSGSLKPSRADEELTQKIKYAAQFHDIAVLDHIIITEEGFYSFAEEGLLSKAVRQALFCTFAPATKLMPGENKMLLIGIDEYPGPKYRALDNAVKDVQRLADILENKYGFTVADKSIYNQDATRATIIEALDELSKSIGKDDNLIIIFGGHGDQHPFTKNGFWVPVDGQKNSDMVSNSAVYDAIDGIQAKHILLISDSCYSGTFITRTREGDKIGSHDELEAIPSRWVFASGGEEGVSDGKFGKGSPFNLNLCEFLQNNELPSVSIGEMFEAVIRMTKASSRQTPMADQIRRTGNLGGQMILRLNSTRSASVVKPTKLSFALPQFPFTHYLSRTVTYYEFQREEISYFFDPEKGKTFLNEVFLTHRKIVLLGSAGSGKSVELQNLGQQLTDESTPYVPIYKRFNTYTGQDIEAYLPEGWEKVNPLSAVLLLDGLDEIQTPFFFGALRKLIEFCNKRPEMRMVISCRTNFYELPTATFSGTLEGFSVFTLNDISLAEIRNYAATQLQLDGQEFIKAVYEASFLDLIQKPYFLDLLVRHYTQNGSFPANRTIIFEEALLNYYNNDREHFKTTGQLLTKPETFSLLEKIAFIMEVMGKNFITDDELHKLFPQQTDFEKCKYLPAFKRNDKTGQWMFEHNNIQEFLAARILSQKTFDKLIEIISLTSAGSKKVKHTWVNTLSFFISIDKTDKGDKVLEWIAENDAEVIIRFEPDRISDQKRIAVFKQIFEFYDSKQIWLTSNKFSDSDLAKFGKYDEVVEYLIERISNPKYSRITKLNAIRVLDNYDLNDFTKYAASIKASLLSLFDAEGMNDYDLYAVLGALANLGIADAETINLVITKFRRHKNQYIRAGLYKLLNHSSVLEEHLDIIFEGLDLGKIENPVEDRESVNLMDESFHLETALKQVKSPEGLKKLLALFTRENTRYILFSEHKDVLPEIIENSITAFANDPSVYEYFREYFMISENLYNKAYAQKILPFFERTNTEWKLFTDIWKNKNLKDYDKSQLVEVLMTDEMIHQFIDGYKKGEFSQADAEILHQLLFWKDRNHPEYEEYLNMLETVSQNSFGITLQRPVLKDWSLINKKRAQDAFDLLFDKQALFQEVESIFKEIDKDEIAMTDLFDYRSRHNESLEDRHIESAIELIRHFTYHGRTVTLVYIEQFIFTDTEFLNYQIESIYNHLHGSQNSYIEITEEQLDFITNWCVEKGNNYKILWFFIHRFSIRLEKSRLLDLVLYYDYHRESKLEEPGTIEQLENFIPRQELKVKVLANLKAGITNSLSWLSNAGYAVRHNIKQAYPSILKRLESVDDTQYKFHEILEFWFKKTADTKRMTSLIENVYSDYLQWTAIRLLINSGKEQTFLNGYLKRIMQNEARDRDSRFTAAGYLMRMNDLAGLHFCAKEILDNPDSKFDFRHELNNMSQLKDARAIPELMKLLYLGKQPEYQLDRFNSLESVVTDSLYHIGIESDSNFVFVKDAIAQFIMQYEDELGSLNFLHFTVKKMEEQLNMKKSQDYSIDQALVEWEKSQ